MTTALSIGDFSRMTQLSVKTLRHYHEVGLLEPDRVDPATSYRYYAPEQVATAQVVRRLRELGMPIADVRAVLSAAPADRNTLIGGHLKRLETELAATRSAVESLRAILERPAAHVEHRSVAAASAAVIEETVDRDELLPWWQGAVGELRGTVTADTRLTPTGAPGALFGFDIFSRDRGSATVFIPVDGEVRPVGRVRSAMIPAASWRSYTTVVPTTMLISPTAHSVSTPPVTRSASRARCASTTTYSPGTPTIQHSG